MRDIDKLSIIFTELGVELAGSFNGSRAMAIDLDGENEFVRVFFPQIISKYSEKIVVGVIASMDRTSIRNKDNITRIADHFALSAFSSNFVSLIDPPAFGVSEDRDRKWCRKISDIMNQFPVNIKQLHRLITNDAQIDGFCVKKMGIRDQYFP